MEETPEGLKRRAYSKGLQLKNSDLEPEVIFARLQKEGIPDELAHQVVEDLYRERIKKYKEETKTTDTLLIIKIVLGLVVMFFSIGLGGAMVAVPVGALIGGVYLLNKRKSTD